MFNKDSLWDFTALACLITVILSPIGIFLMWWKTRWNLKGKLIISGSFGLIYILAAVLIIALNSPGIGGGDGGLGLPSGSTNTEYVVSSGKSGGGGGGKPSKSKSGSSKGSDGATTSSQDATNVTAVNKTSSSKAIFGVLIFFAVFLLFIFRLSKRTKK